MVQVVKEKKTVEYSSNAFEAFCEWQRRRVITPLQTCLRSFLLVSKILNEAPLLIVSLWICWYWCGDGQLAIRRIWLLPICEISNGLMKQLFRHPRPGWIRRYPVKYHQWSSEYSFPSSDAQIVACCCSALFEYPSSVAIVTLSVCVNRLFAGAHYIHDVIVGASIGFLITFLYVTFDAHAFIGHYQQENWPVLVALTLPLCIIQAVFIFCHDEDNPQVREWEKKASEGRKTILKMDILEAHLKQVTGMYGLFLALVASMPPEYHAISRPKSSRIFYLRILLGQSLVVGAYVIIALITPKKPSVVMHILRGIRYGSIPLFTFHVAPYIFRFAGID
mmetsp:Transcript_19394/g.28963  ORF Transcript_19394/g.28963 Transcript_19394/m.28963 type:complete len:335 (+) Transcript_19394:42-1046(+)